MKNPNDNKNIALKLTNKKVYGSDLLTWKPDIPTNLRSKNDTTFEDLWNDAGASSHFRVGPNFIEARFSRSSLLKVLGETDLVYLNFTVYIEQKGSGVSESYGIVYFKK